MISFLKRVNGWSLPTKIGLLLGVLGLVWGGSHTTQILSQIHVGDGDNVIGDGNRVLSVKDSPGSTNVNGDVNVQLVKDIPVMKYEVATLNAGSKEPYVSSFTITFGAQNTVDFAENKVAPRKDLGTCEITHFEFRNYLVQGFYAPEFNGKQVTRFTVTCKSVNKIFDDGSLFILKTPPET